MPRVIKAPAPRRRGVAWQITAIAGLVIAGLVIAFTVIRTDPPDRSIPVVVSTSEWIPYISPELPNDGPVAELLSEVFGRAGYTPEFIFTTWPLAERDTRNGASIGMAPVIVSPQRKDFALYSDPLLDFQYTLFGKKGTLLGELPDRTGLEGLRIARIAGYQYWPELDESGADFKDYPSSLSAFEALKAGEVDLVAEGSIAGNAVLKGASFDGDASAFATVDSPTPLTTSTQGLHLLIRNTPEGERLQKEFNAALKDFSSTEDYQRIVSSLQEDVMRGTLTASGGGAVEVFGQEGSPAGFTPSNTAVMVLDWPGGSLGRETLIRVKVMNGPLAGRVLSVRLEDLELNDA